MTFNFNVSSLVTMVAALCIVLLLFALLLLLLTLFEPTL